MGAKVKAGSKMTKNYVGWYRLKMDLNKKEFLGNFSEREVWWCSVGVNIGYEEDGKNELIERPVLVVRKYGKQLFMGIPLSTTVKSGIFYSRLKLHDIESVALLTQARSFSAKRLSRRIGVITSDDLRRIMSDYKNLINLPDRSENPLTESEDFRAPSGDLYSDNSKPEAESQAKGAQS